MNYNNIIYRHNYVNNMLMTIQQEQATTIKLKYSTTPNSLQVQNSLSASCWNWRGIPSSLTTKDMIALCLSKRDISLLCIRVMTGSLTYRKYCYLGQS